MVSYASFLLDFWIFSQEKWGGYKTKFIKFVLPYLCYSVLFYLIFSPEPLLKNVIRTLYGGRLNTLLYSYPFWFINAYAIVNLGFGYLINKNLKIGKSVMIDYATLVFVLSYILIHTPLLTFLPYPLPVSIDCAFGAFVYYYLGYKLQQVNIHLNRKTIIILIIPVVFVGLNAFFGWGYEINMKDVEYNSLLLDFVIPLSFVYLFYIISTQLKKVTVLSKVLAYIGCSSMTIFFTHAATLYVFNSHVAIWLNVLLTMFLGVVAHSLFSKYKYTKILFLGVSKK